MSKLRVSVRLDKTTLTIIDVKRYATENRTACIERGLRHLHRELSLRGEKFNPPYDLTKRVVNDGQTEAVQLRIERVLFEYFKFNLYNLTTCIKAAVLLL